MDLLLHFALVELLEYSLRLLLAGVTPDPDILEHRNAKIIQLGSYVWRSNPTPAQN